MEISGGGLLGGPSFEYQITDAGRSRALLFLEQSHYVGVAPVPFVQYAGVHGAVRTDDAEVGDAQPVSERPFPISC